MLTILATKKMADQLISFQNDDSDIFKSHNLMLIQGPWGIQLSKVPYYHERTKLSSGDSPPLI